MIINWANGQLQINSPHLQPLLKEIRDQISNFVSISFQHVYRELNVEADTLSKLALTLPLGLMEVKDHVDDQLVNQYVRL